jgi:threonine efflux protein
VNSLLILFVVHLFALMTPGPDFLIVSKVAISSSRRSALLTATGIAVGVMVWAAVALLGLHLLLEQITWLRMSIKVAGGGYLVYLGVLMFKASFRTGIVKQNDGVNQPAIRGRRAFVSGLLTNLANPKVAVYFGSIFANFLTPVTSAKHKAAMFMIVSLEALLWFVFVGTMFSLPAVRRVYRQSQTWIDRLAGAVFILFGLHLMLTGQH